MAIRFELPEGRPAALAFGYSPLLETVLSLHVLAEPKHHALQHGWVRAMRKLPAGLRREIGDLSFLYRWTLPNAVLPSAATPYEEFQDELGRLRGDAVALDLLRTLHDHGGRGRRRLLADAGVRAAALKRAGTLGRGAQRAARLLFDDPPAFVERFAQLLEGYWAAAFADEWRRLEPRLAESVAAAGRQIAAEGMYPFLVGLAPQLRVETAAGRFGLDVPHDHRVPLDSARPLLLVPSFFVWPHVRVNCDPPWPLALVYRAPHLTEAFRTAAAPELVRGLRALGDPTRLRMLQQIARRPRSTQELARLVGLSEAGTSKQLRALAAAGILETRREGYYVVYSLVGDAVEGLADDVRRLATS
jgi:DNA-binding transcriptional ArsR family regulator